MNRNLLKYGGIPVNGLAAAGARERPKTKKQRLKKRRAPSVNERAVEQARRALERAAWKRGQ